MLVAKAINKLYPGREWSDNGASVIYSLCGHVPHALPTQPSELMLQAKLTWQQQLFRTIKDGKDNEDSECLAGVKLDDEYMLCCVCDALVRDQDC
jgi:hypothetical protein